MDNSDSFVNILDVMTGTPVAKRATALTVKAVLATVVMIGISSAVDAGSMAGASSMAGVDFISTSLLLMVYTVLLIFCMVLNTSVSLDRKDEETVMIAKVGTTEGTVRRIYRN